MQRARKSTSRLANETYLQSPRNGMYSIRKPECDRGPLARDIQKLRKKVTAKRNRLALNNLSQNSIAITNTYVPDDNCEYKIQTSRKLDDNNNNNNANANENGNGNGVPTRATSANPSLGIQSQNQSEPPERRRSAPDSIQPISNSYCPIPSTSSYFPIPSTSRDAPIPSTSSCSLRPSTSRNDPVPSTSRDAPIPSTSSYCPVPSTSSNYPIPSTSRDAPIQSRPRNVPAASSSRINHPVGIGRGKGGIRRLREALERETLGQEFGQRRSARQMNMIIDRVQRQREQQEQEILRNIRDTEYYLNKQHSIPMIVIMRNVKQILSQLRPETTFRVQYAAMEAIRDVAEDFMVDKFEKCCLLTAHAGRVTCMPKDLHLVMRMDKKRGKR